MPAQEPDSLCLMLFPHSATWKVPFCGETHTVVGEFFILSTKFDCVRPHLANSAVHCILEQTHSSLQRLADARFDTADMLHHSFASQCQRRNTVQLVRLHLLSCTAGIRSRFLVLLCSKASRAKLTGFGVMLFDRATTWNSSFWGECVLRCVKTLCALGTDLMGLPDLCCTWAIWQRLAYLVRVLLEHTDGRLCLLQLSVQALYLCLIVLSILRCS